MLSNIFRKSTRGGVPMLVSRLYDDQSFFPAFKQDLGRATSEVVIESPFITTRRVRILLPILQRLVSRGVKVTVNTRHPDEHDQYLRSEALNGLMALRRIGAEVLYTGGHHRKICIIDRRVLYEGSLNILSQNESCEIMRRIESTELAEEMISFLKIEFFL